MTVVELARMGGRASARARRTARRMRILEWAPVAAPAKPIPVNPGNDEKVNNMNCVKNIRAYLAAKALAVKSLTASLALVTIVAHGTITPGFSDRLGWTNSISQNVSYRVYAGPSNGVWTVTNNLPMGPVGPAGISSYILTNFQYGNWWFQVRSVATNGTLSDPTPAIQWTNNPEPPTGLEIKSSTNAMIEIWIPLPTGIATVESADNALFDGSSPFTSIKNLSSQPAKQLGMRVSTDDPRKFYRALIPAAMLKVGKPPTP